MQLGEGCSWVTLSKEECDHTTTGRSSRVITRVTVIFCCGRAAWSDVSLRASNYAAVSSRYMTAPGSMKALATVPAHSTHPPPSLTHTLTFTPHTAPRSSGMSSVAPTTPANRPAYLEQKKENPDLLQKRNATIPSVG